MYGAENYIESDRMALYDVVISLIVCSLFIIIAHYSLVVWSLCLIWIPIPLIVVLY